jgi:hypothetical protein
MAHIEMSAGHHPSDWATADTARVESALGNKQVRGYLERMNRESSSYDLPYLAGYSKDGTTLYFDRHLPNELRVMVKNGWRLINPKEFVALHEETEKAIIDALGWKYEKAHEVANAVERRAVIAAGLSWKAYEAALEPYIKADEVERLEFIPPDLDWTPYLTPPINRRLVARMKEAEEVD